MDKNEVINKKIFSSVAWSYAERFLAQAVSLFVSVILARLLDVADYGVVAIVLVFTNIMEILITGGYGNALIQKKDTSEIDYHTVFWINITIAIVEYLILFFAAPFISQFYEIPALTLVVRVLGLRVFFSAIHSVQIAFVQKTMQFRKFFFATLGGTLGSVVVGIILALKGAGVWALVAQYMVSSFANVLVLCFCVSWRPKFKFSIHSMKQMMSFGTMMFLATVVNAFQDNLRSLVVGKKFSVDTLANYNQGKKYPQLLMSDIVGSIGKVMFPVLSMNQSKDESKRLMRSAVRVGSYILTPIVLGIVAVADNFVLAVLTEKWLGCVVFMRILALVYITRPISTILQNALLGAGYGKSNLVHEFCCALLSLVLIFVAVFIWKSVLMVAISYFVVMVIGLFIRIGYSVKYLDYSFLEIARDYLPYLFLSFVACGGAFIFGFVNMNVWALLVCQISVGVVLYIALSIIFKVPEFAQCVRLAKTIFRKNRAT